MYIKLTHGRSAGSRGVGRNQGWQQARGTPCLEHAPLTSARCCAPWMQTWCPWKTQSHTHPSPRHLLPVAAAWRSAPAHTYKMLTKRVSKVLYTQLFIPLAIHCVPWSWTLRALVQLTRFCSLMITCPFLSNITNKTIQYCSYHRF